VTRVRLGAVGALAGFLAGVLVGLPATAAVHAVIVSGYHETLRDFTKLTSCANAPAPITCMPPSPNFWAEVLPLLSFWPIFFALLAGAALGLAFVVIRSFVPLPSLVWAPFAGVLYALPALLGGSSVPYQLDPWESAFAFVTYPGMVTETNRLFLLLPDIAGAVAIAILVTVLNRWLPPVRSPVTRGSYWAIATVASLGFAVLLVTVGAFPLGGD
jgi:hypothetical protein